MNEFEDDDIVVPDELTTLKARADLLGVSYHPSIGLEKLKEKVASAVSVDDEPTKDEPVAEDESPGAMRLRKKKEANELIRVRVSCMNPAKKEWGGELFTAGNSVVGSFTKFIPFNTEDGWHIPRIIYNQLTERQCQIFYSHKDGNGNSTRKGKLLREFAVEVLPNLTPEELNQLAQRQAMAKGM